MPLPISLADIAAFDKTFSATPQADIALNAVAKSGLAATCIDNNLRRRMRYAFSLEVDQGKVTNQMGSGRCWMFAALNTMRVAVMRKLNLETCELSQSYSLFYDKLEKSNYFLCNILDTLDEPTDGRLIAWLLSGPLGDGGQWDMFVNIVNKYGVVPKECMPETFHSSNTGMMTKFLTLKLREFACTLRAAYKAGTPREELLAQKQKMMSDIYGMLCVCLGRPPLTVEWECRDKDKKFQRVGPLSPTDFFKQYVGWDLSEYVSLINAPTADKPYDRTYTVQFLGNVKDGNPVLYLNVPSQALKDAAIAQLKAGDPVWFGCDVGQWLDGEWGSMDLDGFNFSAALGVDFPMTKAQRLDYGESLMTHAMVFTGVNLDENGKPNRWRVENSWGDKRGNEGQFIMADDWFDEYMYQVVVHKKYLTAEQLEQLKQKPIELKPWDPMGSLAL